MSYFCKLETVLLLLAHDVRHVSAHTMFDHAKRECAGWNMFAELASFQPLNLIITLT